MDVRSSLRLGSLGELLWPLHLLHLHLLLLLSHLEVSTGGVVVAPSVEGNRQAFRERPRSVAVGIGGDVTLRCAVDHQQGRVQWTKDGFALGFERGVPGYPRYEYLGAAGRGEHHLAIRGVTLQDDGEYQCQVGPTPSTPPIWAAANVTVMVSPTSIELVGVSDGGVVEARAGSRVQLECVVRDARPSPTVAWYRDAITLSKDSHREEVWASGTGEGLRWDVRSRLLVTVTASDDMQQFSCRGLHPALQHSPTTLVATVTVHVLHSPGPPSISGYRVGEALTEGEERTLVCTVQGGRPRPWITWYRHGRPLTRPALAPDPSATPAAPATTTTAQEAPPSRRFQAEQRVRAWREEDGAVYECRVSSDLLPRPLATNVTLTVHYAPERVSISGPSVVSADQLFTLTCRSSPANPPPTLTWRMQGSRVASGSSVVSEGEGGGWVTSSRITHALTPTLTHTSAQCHAAHPAATRPLSTTHVITVIKRPGWPVVEIEGGGTELGEEGGGQVDVVCSSRGGNPPPTLTIFKGGEAVTGAVEEGVDVGVSRVRARLHVTRADNGRQVTCEVATPALTTPMAAHATLNLLFAPSDVTVEVSPERVEAGQEVELRCQSGSSLPPATLTWHSTSSSSSSTKPFLQPAPSTTHSPALFGGTVARSEVRLVVAPSDHGRLISCLADNGVSPSVSANVTLDVLHGPVWVWAPEGELDVREGEDFTVTALATANPGPVRYSWWYESKEVEGVAGSAEGEAAAAGGGGGGRLVVERINRHLSGNYTVLATTATPATPTRGLSTQAASINATFTINVQYGPEDLLAARRVTVDEDGAATVLCSASGNPTPNVSWTGHSTDFSTRRLPLLQQQQHTGPPSVAAHPRNTSSVGDAILASGLGEARLVVEAASVSDTGLYLCHATSPLATPPPVSTAIVVTQAPTSVSEEGRVGDRVGQAWAPVGGTGLLDCRVRAAPAPIFTWALNTNNDKILTSGRKYIIHVPQLVDKVTEWSSVLEVRGVTVRDHARYTCTAHNSRGSHAQTFNLSPPLLPATPWNMNVTAVSNSVVLVTWRANPFGAPPAGFTVRYRLAGATQFQHVDVRGSNATGTTIKGLKHGAEYTFSMSAYNNRGSSNYTAPSPKLNIFSVVEGGAASSSSVGGRQKHHQQQRVPRLIILLICLTATALFVLNVSIVVCFLKRQATKRNISASSSKTTALEVYTPTGSAVQVDEFPLASVSEEPPPQYQEEYDESDGSEGVIYFCEGEPGVRAAISGDGHVGHIIAPPLLHHRGLLYVAGFDIVLPTPPPQQQQQQPTDPSSPPAIGLVPLVWQSGMSLESQTRMEESEHTCLISPCSASHTPEPLAPASPTSRSGSPLLNGGVARQGDLFLPDGARLSSDCNSAMVSPASAPLLMPKEHSSSTDIVGYALNNPDVCPATSGSCDPLLEQQDTYQYVEVDQVSLSSQHSSESYGFSQSSSKSDRIRITQQGVLNTQQQQQVQRFASQVTYHGQPHLQQQLEQEQLQQEQQQQYYHKTSPSSSSSSSYYKPGSGVHSPGYNNNNNNNPPLHRVSSFKSALSPSAVSPSTRYPDDTSPHTHGLSVGCVSQPQPRRSCLKSPHVSGLQRSHSVHNYTYTSLQCVHHHHHTASSCQDAAFCSNPQLHAQPPQTAAAAAAVPAAAEASDFLVCYSKPRARSVHGCTRHNSISGYIGYRNPLRQEKVVVESAQVPPDLCKVTPSGTKRVGWKEVLHESSSELGPPYTADGSVLAAQAFPSPTLAAHTFNQGSRGCELGSPAYRGSEMASPAFRGSEMESPSFRGSEMRQQASTDTSTSSTTSTLTLGPRPPPPPPRCVRQDSVRSNTSDQHSVQDQR